MPWRAGLRSRKSAHGQGGVTLWETAPAARDNLRGSNSRKHFIGSKIQKEKIYRAEFAAIFLTMANTSFRSLSFRVVA